MKRRLFLALLLAAILTSAGAASAATFGVLITPTSTTGATTPVDSGGATQVFVHCWRHDNAAASTTLVYLQGSIDKVHWKDLATFQNVTGMNATTGAGGDGVSVVSWPWMRVYISDLSVGTLDCIWMKR